MGSTRVYMWLHGPEENLPAPGIESRLYFARDTGRTFIDRGTAWETTQLSFRGAYVAGTAYRRLDLVTHAGSSWVALRQSTNVTPSEGADWTIKAAKGGKGDTGATGPTGATGATGPQGESAYTSTTAAFAQPAIGSTVSVSVGNTSWMAAGEAVYVAGGGYYSVSSITNPTTAALNNLGYSENAAADATVGSASAVTPSGVRGQQGSSSTPQATETVLGGGEIATQAETDAGTADTFIVTPLKLANTPRLPTQGENDAQQGTAGTPSNTNRYVTDQDARNTNTRTPTDASVTLAKAATDVGFTVITETQPAAPFKEGASWYQPSTDRTFVNVGTAASPVFRQLDGPLTFAFSKSGSLTAGAIPLRWRLRRNITIAGFYIAINTLLGGGTLTVDLDRATAGTPGTMASLYATTANRPSITTTTAYDAVGGLPDTVAIPAGDFLQARIATAPTGGADLSVFIDYHVRA